MKRIKIWHILVLLIAMLTMIPSCKKDDIVYELEFDIEVPEDWDAFANYFDDFIRYYALSPERLEDDAALVKDTIIETIFINRYYRPSSSLNEFNVELLNALVLETNFMVLYASDTIVNGENARKLMHTQTIRKPISTSPLDSMDFDIQPIKLVLYHNEYGYIIDCTALPYTFPYYKEIFEEEVIPTFVFKE